MKNNKVQEYNSPKEKAKELIDKFTQTNGNSFFAKECALIAVDEILKLKLQEVYQNSDYWQEVKQEIVTYRGNK
jgi:hypothetical protein